jgi:hypothetical protein
VVVSISMVGWGWVRGLYLLLWIMSEVYVGACICVESCKLGGMAFFWYCGSRDQRLRRKAGDSLLAAGE